MSDKTCGTCEHWHKIVNGSLDLSEIRGECREGPPSVIAAVLPNGQQAMLSAYPKLPPNFPACSRHWPSEIHKELTIAARS